MRPLQFDLVANQEIRQSRQGTTIFVQSVDGEIRVTAYAGNIIVGQADMVTGNSLQTQVAFDSLLIVDLSGAANSVELIAGLGDFREAGLGTIDQITQPVDTNVAWPDYNTFLAGPLEVATISSGLFASKASYPNGIIVHGLRITHADTVASGAFTTVDADGGANGDLAVLGGPSRDLHWYGRMVLPAADYRITSAGTGASLSIWWQSR